MGPGSGPLGTPDCSVGPFQSLPGPLSCKLPTASSQAARHCVCAQNRPSMSGQAAGWGEACLGREAGRPSGSWAPPRPPPPPKAVVSDFCNIVSQGFPGQHAQTVFVTPSGCLAAGRGQDGACSSPDTLLHSLAPCCPPGRLPAFREDRPWPGPGKGQGGWWARSGLHRHCPHPDPPPECL